MVVKTYGYKSYPCGCVISVTAMGYRIGHRVMCDGCNAIMGSMLADKRPQTRQVAQEWRDRFDEHFAGQTE